MVAILCFRTEAKSLDEGSGEDEGNKNVLLRSLP